MISVAAKRASHIITERRAPHFVTFLWQCCGISPEQGRHRADYRILSYNYGLVHMLSASYISFASLRAGSPITIQTIRPLFRHAMARWFVYCNE
jgi:hypothetical protein